MKEELFRFPSSRLETFSRRNVIFEAGQPIRGVALLRTGRALEYEEGEKRCGKDPMRIRASYGIHYPGSLLGATDALIGNTYTHTIRTLEPCKIALVPVDKFMNTYCQDPFAWTNFWQQLTQESLIAEKIIAWQRFNTLPERVAHLLLTLWELDKRFGIVNAGKRPTMNLLSQGEIGGFVGVSQEKLNRTLVFLEESMLIWVARFNQTHPALQVSSWKRLARYASPSKPPAVKQPTAVAV